MNKVKKTNSRTVVHHLRDFTEFLEQSADKFARKEAAEWLNIWLDEWLSRDVFGTEGQLDPRGDHRE